MNWRDLYDAWQTRALTEYNDKFGCSRVLYDVEGAPMVSKYPSPAVYMNII